MVRWLPVGWIFAFLALGTLTEASHFRHGSIMWSPDDSNSNTVHFSFRIGWRRSSSGNLNCDQNMKSSGQLINYGGSWKAGCDNSYNSLCGSSLTISNTYFYCTDYSVPEDWTVGENNFTYTFSNSEKQWHVSYSGCCWISLSHYAGSAGWKVETVINLAPRSDNGKINSSPVTRSPAIVRFPGGCRQSFRIPVEDPDGDTVKCRFATYSESHKVNTSFPYGKMDEKSCVLTYNGSQAAVGGIFAIALTLEDFPAGTTNFASATPFSGIPLQFLVMVIGNHAGHCDEKPVFTASTPKDGECSDLPIGSAYRAVIEVQVADFSKSIVEISTASPSGMQLTSLRNHGQIYYRNVTWYPSQYQIGQQLFCFKASDSAGLESEWRCVTILVGTSSTPRVLLASRMPMTPVSKYGSGYSYWSIRFDRLIKKPRTSSFIRLVLLPSGQTVYKVDALSQNVTIGSNSTTLHFAIPHPVLSMEGSYAILMDRGVVVGQGCSSSGTPTPGISSSSAWRFYVNGVCSSGYSLRSPYFLSCVDVDECAYSGSKGPSNIFPELTLTAGCDQDCDNTPGNYSCSCERGFQLQSNGKSCTDINECTVNNGGCSHQCFNIPGTFYCGCPKGLTMGLNNLTCVDQSASVSCGENRMTVSLEKQRFHYFTVNQLRLRYASCKANENSTHFLISTSLDSCGTQRNETEDYLIFWNEVLADALIIDGVVTRTHDIKLPFYCRYSRKKLMSLAFTPQRIYFGNETGYGSFTFKMDFYRNSSFATPFTEQDYPLSVALNEYVYLQYSVASSADLVIMAENCKATKDASFYSWPQYTFLRNGCPTDSTLDYSYNPTRHYQQFKIRALRFWNDYDTVYFHCELLACHHNYPDSRCSKGCIKNKRKRREVTRDGGNQEESTNKIILTGGPVVFEAAKEDEPLDHKLSQSKHTALIGGVAGAGVFGLVAVVALAVLLVKFRRTQRLPNSNNDERVGHNNLAFKPEDDVKGNQSSA
nr:uncharacterized protein LOC131780658 [Pocillopora verrucosa]